MKGYLKTLTLNHTLDFETLIQGRNNSKLDNDNAENLHKNQ